MCALLLALCAFPAHGAAEPILVRGDITLSSHGGDFPDIEAPILELLFYFDQFVPPLDGVVSRSGDVLATSPVHGTIGGLEVVFPALPAPLAAGARVDLSTSATWTNGTIENHVIAGCCVETESYRSAGTLVLTGGTATLLGDEDWLEGHARFTVQGAITAFDQVTGLPVFTQDVAGAGLARLVIQPSGDRFTYRYEIEPIPEPATLVLLGLGAAGFAVRTGATRRARRASRRP